MARLHEHQGKALLHAAGVGTPRGAVAGTPEEARAAAESLGCPVVLKIQAWTTGRAAIGGVAFADTPDQAAEAAARLLTIRVGAFPVTEVLVEERLPIAEEWFVSLSIDDSARQPMLLLSRAGGSGVEERAGEVARIPAPIASGPDRSLLLAALQERGATGGTLAGLADAAARIFDTARQHEARSLEVNPLAVLTDGRVVAADCRATIDDYAVFRHPDLGIEIARELDHPPSRLERIAYAVEQADHRGTFYFAELPRTGEPGERVIGFHGAGGGGSMMSMDAASKEGFTLANFCDTSGNPSAAKVYAAARIILAQDGLCGYFGSGSGVASQEQFWSAYGLAKAFLEVGLSIPAVVRLGGNSEDRAVEILQDACRGLPAAVEGYRKDDTPAKCAQRFASLVKSPSPTAPATRRVPSWLSGGDVLRIPIKGASVCIDLSRCDAPTTVLVVESSAGLLREAGGRPALAVGEEDAAGKDSEFIACEIECRRAGRDVVFVDMPIPGLDD